MYGAKTRYSKYMNSEGDVVFTCFECKAKKKKQTSLTYLGYRNVLGLNYYYHYYNVCMSVCLWCTHSMV